MKISPKGLTVAIAIFLSGSILFGSSVALAAQKIQMPKNMVIKAPTKVTAGKPFEITVSIPEKFFGECKSHYTTKGFAYIPYFRYSNKPVKLKVLAITPGAGTIDLSCSGDKGSYYQFSGFVQMYIKA